MYFKIFLVSLKIMKKKEMKLILIVYLLPGTSSSHL
jgi:hypothetical protein